MLEPAVTSEKAAAGAVTASLDFAPVQHSTGGCLQSLGVLGRLVGNSSGPAVIVPAVDLAHGSSGQGPRRDAATVELRILRSLLLDPLVVLCLPRICTWQGRVAL